MHGEMERQAAGRPNSDMPWRGAARCVHRSLAADGQRGSLSYSLAFARVCTGKPSAMMVDQGRSEQCQVLVLRKGLHEKLDKGMYNAI